MIKRFLNWLLASYIRWDEARQVAYQLKMDRWEELAETRPCTCGRVHVTAWCHGKQCPRLLCYYDL